MRHRKRAYQLANRPLSQNMNRCHGLGHMLVAQDKSVLDVFPKPVEFPSGQATAGAKPHWSLAIDELSFIDELWFLAATITGERAPIPPRNYKHAGRRYAGFILIRQRLQLERRQLLTFSLLVHSSQMSLASSLYMTSSYLTSSPCRQKSEQNKCKNKI